jgi:hypothetical protein
VEKLKPALDVINTGLLISLAVFMVLMVLGALVS